jgi:hypothetical protein
MIKHRRILSVLFVTLLISCNDRDEDTCVEITKALELPLLKSIVTDGIIQERNQCIIYPEARIYSAIYNSKFVYYFENPTATGTCTSIAFDCHGEEILSLDASPQKWEDFMNEISDTNLIWEKQPKECAVVSNPLEDIVALKSIVINGTVAGRATCLVNGGAQIYGGELKGEAVYYFTNAASSMATCGFIAYDCQGTELVNRAINSRKWDELMNEIEGVEVLWTKNP